jgi:hypothetical protein
VLKVLIGWEWVWGRKGKDQRNEENGEEFKDKLVEEKSAKWDGIGIVAVESGNTRFHY